MREGTTWSPTGSKMHSISCSFYLFVLPSISSRALSSLALASYSSSMNSCCRFLPERKKSHSQSFATQRKGQIWQSIFATVQVQRPLLLEQTQYCKLCSPLWCHSSEINQPVLTLETYPKFTCKQLKSCQYLRPAWKERAGQWLTQSKKNPSNNKRDLRQANIFILFWNILKVLLYMKKKQYNTERAHLMLGKPSFHITWAKLKIKLNTSVQSRDQKKKSIFWKR